MDKQNSCTSSIIEQSSEDNSSIKRSFISRKKRICLVGKVCENVTLDTTARQFGVPVLKSVNGGEYINNVEYCTYFILEKFEGREFEVLQESSHRILGTTALLQLAKNKQPLPSVNRPTYTLSMMGNVVLFTGFRKKDELTRLIIMIHQMGGSIRKDPGSKVTHLIANCCGGEKYRY